MEKITIRFFKQKDINAIAKVMISFYNITSVQEAKKVIKQESKKDIKCIVALVGKKIVGFTTLIFHGLPQHGLCELDRIVLLPDYRGRGIGEKMIDALIACAKDEYKRKKASLRKLYLLTHADNTKAQEFYKCVGFFHETTLKDHYYKNKDEFVMSMFF